MQITNNKKVLFYQHFGKPGVVRGAHHKTFDFYHHIKSFSDYEPFIYFDKESLWDRSIPWFHLFETMPTLDDLDFIPDILFLNSGKDWIKFSQNKEINQAIPIVSPVNNFRATKPGHPSFNFLSRKAVRLCPSPEIYRAVLEHPNTVGETLYVPNGVAVTDHAKKASQQKNTDILIVGNKNPTLSQNLFDNININKYSVDIINGWISKEEFQLRLAQSKISIHLPKPIEEHYIPGIEAMMLNSFVIIPDCIGNRSYSLNNETCLISEYSLKGFLNSLESVLNLPNPLFNNIISKAARSTIMYSSQIESSSIHRALLLAEKL